MHRAFTLVEVLVVIAVLGVLFGLIAAGVARARRSSQAAVCRVNASQLWQLSATYSTEHREQLPHPQTIDLDLADRTETLWLKTQATLSDLPFADSRWLASTGLTQDSPSAHCPASDRFRLTPTDANDPDKRFIFAPDYFQVTCASLDPAYLDPALPREQWSARLGTRANRLADVLFPAQKVALAEHQVWHGWLRDQSPSPLLGGLLTYTSDGAPSVAFFDGHVESRRPTDMLQRILRWPQWPYAYWDLTPFGLRGRDF